MKRLFKGAVEFTKREWFLLVTVSIITLMIILWEVLWELFLRFIIGDENELKLKLLFLIL